jgi:glycosyltransferase involved in cell wall biosynthesis
MKILQLCPLWYPIARDAAGGIETFLAQLVPALQQLDLQISLLASGDSSTAAALLPVVEINLRDRMEARGYGEYRYYEQHLLQLALDRAEEFDVMHSHLGIAGYVLSGLPRLRSRVLHTLHTPVYRDLEWFASRHPDIWLSTVSEFQARKLWQQGATRCRVIPNGIEVAAFTFQPRSGESLLFVGRIEPGKGPDLAIQVARTLGVSLLLAGPILDAAFFDAAIKPFLGDQIQYLGVVDHRRKNELFGQAGCVILPFRREEPFGLVALEAMACGTPVVALANGALPEIVDSGVTGYLANEQESLAPLVVRALELDRPTVRHRVAARFDVSNIAAQYCGIYGEMVAAANSALERPRDHRRQDQTCPDFR